LEDGNGGGVTQLVMGSLLFPLSDLLMATLRGLAYGFCRPAVRVCLVLPFTTSVMTLRGNYSDLKKHGAMPESAAASFRSGAINFNGSSFFSTLAALSGTHHEQRRRPLLRIEFGQSESAAAIASIFGWMNLFARGFGGYFSDKANAKMECVDVSLSKPFCSFRGAGWSSLHEFFGRSHCCHDCLFGFLSRLLEDPPFVLCHMSTRRALDPFLVSSVPVETLVLLDSAWASVSWTTNRPLSLWVLSLWDPLSLSIFINIKGHRVFWGEGHSD
jgi:hypothetical protein